MPGVTPDRQSVLAALERVLGWPEIARSPQLARFLDYIVRRTLDGSEQAIKAYSIAVDVFGRAVDFDPQVDPIVRVQARRLRSLLEQYYSLVGTSDPVRITLPTGRYVPVFEVVTVDAPMAPTAAAAAPKPRQRGDITLSWVALLIITLGIGAFAFGLSSWAPQRAEVIVEPMRGPSVTVVEFQDLSGDGSRPVVAGLALELVTDLNAFEDIEAHYGGGEATATPVVASASDFVLTGIVRRADRAVQYSAILTETASGAVVWSRTIPVAEQRSLQPEALDEISQALSLVLGSPRGPLHLPARKALSRGLPADGVPTLYLCHVLFDLYRETGTAASGSGAATCYARLPESDRQDPTALAAQASLIGEGVTGAGAAALESADRMRVAQASLERAVSEDSLSGFVWEQQARLLELQGQFAAAAAAYASSLQLNPANADALAAAARLMAFQGNLAEAVPPASKALSGSPMPPPWYYAVPTLQALRDRHFLTAAANAQTYAIADPELGSVLAVTAALAGSNAGVVNRYLPQVLEVGAFRAAGILPRLRQRIGDAALLDEIGRSLAAAGVPRRALDRPF